MASDEKPVVQGTNVMPPRRIYLLTAPRTASNLVERILSAQSNVANLPYQIQRPAMWPTFEKFQNVPWDQTSEDDRDFIKTTFQSAFTAFVENVEAEGKEGKSVLAKEHTMILLERRVVYEWSFRESPGPDAHPGRWTDAENRRWTMLMPGETEPRPRTNITMMPDDYLLSWLPIILIRHPALTMPSIQRSYSKIKGGISLDTPFGVMSATLRFSRQIYDWFVEHGVAAAKTLPEKEMRDAWPVVLDAADAATNRDTMSKLCHVAGLNPDELLYEWAPKTEEELSKENSIVQMMGAAIFASSTVVADRHPELVDVEEEHKKWIEEFGEHVANEIRRLTDDAMNDYEYLRERRIRADK